MARPASLLIAEVCSPGIGACYASSVGNVKVAWLDIAEGDD